MVVVEKMKIAAPMEDQTAVREATQKALAQKPGSYDATRRRNPRRRHGNAVSGRR